MRGSLDLMSRITSTWTAKIMRDVTSEVKNCETETFALDWSWA